MFLSQPFEATVLTEKGFILQHIFDLSSLPRRFIETFENNDVDLKKFNQLILLGHGGRKLWHAMTNQDFAQPHPIDHFSCTTFNEAMSQVAPNSEYKILYPDHDHNHVHYNLQQLGQLAGWHHSSPFRVGINSEFGSWFAYRLLVIANTHFPVTKKVVSTSPCHTCLEKPCLTACPASAVHYHQEYEWQKCFDYRVTDDSLCHNRCVARLACPVAKQHQYTIDQVNYHYDLSRKHILK